LVVATWTAPPRVAIRPFSRRHRPCQEDLLFFSGYISRSKSRLTPAGPPNCGENRSGTSDLRAEGDTVRLSTAPMQPLAADDVAAALADVAVGEPVNATIELGGPAAMRLSRL